jgi:hypothetical protein
MKAFVVKSMVLLLVLSAIGCGSTEKGPAKPVENAPVMTEDQVKERYSKGPPEAQKMYEKYKKGGS